MIAAAAGILLGLAIALGPLISWDARVTVVGEQLIAAFASGASALLEMLPYVGDYPEVVETFSVITGVVAPGLVVLLLVGAAKRLKGFRRSLSGLLLLAACLSFFVLPAVQAGVLVVAAVVISTVLLIPAGWLSQVGLWSIATVLAVNNVMTVWYAESPEVADGIAALQRLSGMEAPDFWRVAILATALSPYAFAVLVETKSQK